MTAAVASRLRPVVRVYPPPSTALGPVQVATCGCGEPILKPKVTRPEAERWVRWLHTDERDVCVNRFREPIPGQTACPRPTYGGAR